MRIERRFGSGFNLHRGANVIAVSRLLDPQDDAVLYTAVAAGADVLCVRDRHFYDPHVVDFCAREDIRVTDELALLELLA